MRSIGFWGIIASSAILPLVFAQAINDSGVYETTDGKKCPLAGTAKGVPGKALNRLKNRFTFPDASDVDSTVTLESLLTPGDDTGRFDTNEAATLTGVVIDVKPGGKETCNCGAANDFDRDTHIELALDKDAPEIQRAIVEVTPRIRLLKKNKEIDWTTKALNKQLKGKWVEVTGWLLFDDMHVGEAENTNPGGAKNWRATCWEIHPVTEIKVLDGPPKVAPSLTVAALKTLHATHAQHARRDPKKQAAIKKNIEDVLSKYTKEELEEKEEESKERQKQK
jgi:hypothetical protein